MKLKKNDLLELKKGGAKAIDSKLAELAKSLAEAKLELSQGKLKNLALPRTLRRAIAQLITVRHELTTNKNKTL